MASFGAGGVIQHSFQRETIEKVFSLFHLHGSFPGSNGVKELGLSLLSHGLILNDRWNEWKEKNKGSPIYAELRFFKKEIITKPQSRDVVIDWLLNTDEKSK